MTENETPQLNEGQTKESKKDISKIREMYPK